MGFLRLVFANLMRNKVRTVLTTLSVFVALFLVVRDIGLLGADVPYDRVVATEFSHLWKEPV